MVQDDWPDDALYAGLVARDAAALEALILRYMREITYFIRLLLNGVGTAQDAEECANDLFVIAWQEIKSYTPSRGSLHTWLTMRAKYIALDRRRQLQRRQSAVTSLDGEATVNRAGETRSGERRFAQLTDHNMEGILERRERQEELAAALNGLPDLDRKLVYLRYFRLASTDEISTETGLSRHAIDTRLWRARKTLRDALEEHTYEPVRSLKRSRKR